MFFLQKSIQGAVIILVIIIVRALFINKLPKRTFLILWAVAVFCLLFPFSLKSKFSVYALAKKESVAIAEAAWDKFPSGSHTLEQTGGGTETDVSVGEDSPAVWRNSADYRGGLLEEYKEETERVTGEESILQKEAPWVPGSRETFWQSFSKSGLWMSLWMAGAVLCAGYFGIAYFRCRRVFAVSLPVENETADIWLAAHSLRRKITIRQSGRVLAPLTYGIFAPVILMPENTNWGDRKDRAQASLEENPEGGGVPSFMAWELRLCLEHEFVHIKRLDGVTKLILTAALCLHWFNPMVFAMYILANRDLELSCDETVVRLFGEHVKSAYARTLIHMEEVKSSSLPLCSNFSKNAIEERITAIMKIKKLTFFKVAAAVFLVSGITLTFATQAAEKGEVRDECVKEFLGSAYTQEETEMLAALWFEDYENMKVKDFQEKAWTLRDTQEYLALEERLSTTVEEYEPGENGEEPNAFWEYFYYVYEPLTAEKWQVREFGGYTTKDLATKEHPAFPKAGLEYTITLSILNAKELTVKEYNDTRLRVTEDLYEFWQERTVQELADEEGMEEMLSHEIKRIESRRSSEKLAVSIGYYFNPADVNHFLMDEAENKEDGERAYKEDPYGEENEWEERQYPYGTRADYDSLLTLRTQDYEELSLEAFNEKLLDWCNHNPEAMERIGTDTFKDDYQVELTEEEKRFAALTVQLSRFENAAMVTSQNTGKPEEDPWWGGNKYMEAEGDMWCALYFRFSYHISDKSRVMVGERDRCIGAMMERILKFWDETELEERIKLSEEEVASRFEAWAEECSSGQVTVKTDKDQIQYETMDEREYAQERVYLGTVTTQGNLQYYISADTGEKQSKYFHLTVTNQTEKEISGITYTMLAYNSQGRPLEVYWNFMDSSQTASYECTVGKQCVIEPGETLDDEGGWSVYDLESPWGLIDLSRYGEEYKVACVLSCITQITFEDGTVWSNPDYESWWAECCGKQVPQSAFWEYNQREYEIFGSQVEN